MSVPRPDDRTGFMPRMCENYLSHMLLFTNNDIYIEKAEQHGIARHPAAWAFASLCMPTHTRPLLLQHAAPLRVSSFMRTCPQRSQLRHRQAPGRMHICITVRAPPHAPPPAAARGPAEGYFTCANSSAAAPRCVFLPKRCVWVRTFASFRRIARARVCTPFRYRCRVRTHG